jgi:hypothetical protein
MKNLKGLRSLQTEFLRLKDQGVLKPEEFDRFSRTVRLLHRVIADGNRKATYAAVDELAKHLVMTVVRNMSAEE